MLRVLFVSTGNYSLGISPIIKAQGESIKAQGVEIDYFTIKGKGVKGYLSNIKPLRSALKNKSYHLIHAHYSLSAIFVSIACPKVPVIVSLMGSDVKRNFFYKKLIAFFSYFFWKGVIVKSSLMHKILGLENALIIPNGVNFNVFKEIDKSIAKKKVFFNDKKHIVFIANPKRYEKNYPLAKKAVDLLRNKNVELNVVYSERGIQQKEIPYYISASDVLLLTSLSEGSPNVIKEAMACNCPIVSTDVGDVRSIIESTEGCYLTSYNPIEVAEKLKLALDFSSRTTGRRDIYYLDSEIIAKEIVFYYNKILGKTL